MFTKENMTRDEIRLKTNKKVKTCSVKLLFVQANSDLMVNVGQEEHPCNNRLQNLRDLED